MAAARRRCGLGPRLKPLPLLALAAAALAAGPARAADTPAPAAAPPDLVHAQWPAQWIMPPGADPRAPGVYHFRKRISLGSAPERYVVHVSADNRFIFYVNGTLVGRGPARGDLDHWRYETFELAPYLKAGDNTLAATVWNAGYLAPVAQVSNQTGFLVQGDGVPEVPANTDPSWQVEAEPGVQFLPIVFADVPSYYAADPGERVDARACDWDWQRSDGPGWRPAVGVGTGQPGRYPAATPYGTGSGITPWFLVPDPLPPMEDSAAGVGRVARTEGMAPVSALPATVPAHAQVALLFDRGAVTAGYPVLDVSGGAGASVRLTYSEALYDAHGRKGNRNEVEGRTINGLKDTFVADGGRRTWSPLWWRTWRYLQLDIATADAPVTIEGLDARFSGFPMEVKGAVSGSDPVLARMWETGARTVRMNAHETYMDGPYWEQLQYTGDTRIQALVSYVTFGEDRLARQAIDAFDQSRTDDGITQGHYPASLKQIIPTFSLYWIGMIHDYWMYRPDAAPLRAWTVHTRSVLDWYHRYQRADALLGLLPWWNFGDWTRDFVFGVPPQDADGGSAFLSLAYAGALREAADLEDAVGSVAIASDERARADRIVSAVRARCWDAPMGLLADTPAHAHYSEETNALGVLLDAVPRASEPAVMRALLAHAPPNGPVPPPGEFSPASLYFRFYVARALDHAGLDEAYLGTLGPWRTMLDLGLSTWAEMAEPTRSDDHGWSAHPNYDLVTLVAGIRPGSPGFATVRVEPHLGPLTQLTARLPHPKGEIREDFSLQADAATFAITLPPGLSGTFFWQGHAAALHPGANPLSFAR